MKRNDAGVNRCWLRFALTASIAAAWWPAAALADEREAEIADGRQLFERQFESTEPVPGRGDGLGPVFNHVSCVSCHQQGGIGGSGPVDVNAAMLSVDLTRLDTQANHSRLMKLLQAIHPGFVTDAGDISTSVILHRFGTDPRYGSLRAGLVGAAIPFKPDADERSAVQQSLSKKPVQLAKGTRSVRLVVSQRNTTPLFGAGLIDQIPDSALHALALSQSKHPEVSGRVAPIGLEKVGRFGWRGQTEHLHDFVLGACANELGLEVPGTPQPLDPLRPEYKPAWLDLSGPECKSLTTFVAALPAPKFVPPESDDQKEVALHGEKVFSKVGCAVCHVETVGPARGVYSDLLLHDLGPALADPVLAKPTLVPSRQQLTSSENILTQPGRPTQMQTQPQYYGGVTIRSATFASDSAATTFQTVNRRTALQTDFQPLPSNLSQEWRTPPLWGLADSGPYLHDGRAATVVEAIALHGGEAEGARQRYFALSVADRMALLEFLGRLQAP
jgi:CxxC motif-containing protein (DUF1111 family)